MSVKLMGMVLDTALPATHKLLALVLTNYANDAGDHVYPSVTTMARQTSLTERSVQRILSDFRATGLLEIVDAAKQHKTTTYRVSVGVLSTMASQGCHSVTPARGDIGDTPGVTLATSRGDTGSPDPLLIRERTVRGAQRKKKPARTRFVKPTAEQVQEYCDERDNGIDGEAFVNFYTGKDWKIGTSPMKDWKAAVRTWEGRRKESGGDRDRLQEIRDSAI